MNARTFENLRKDDASRSAKGLTRTCEWRPQKKNPFACSFILKILALRGIRASQGVIHLENLQLRLSSEYLLMKGHCIQK